MHAHFVIYAHILTKLKIDAYRTASGTQGRLRGALTSQEIAKYVKYCLKPGKAPGPDKCPNELLKTMSDEEIEDLNLVPIVMGGFRTFCY